MALGPNFARSDEGTINKEGQIEKVRDISIHNKRAEVFKL